MQIGALLPTRHCRSMKFNVYVLFQDCYRVQTPGGGGYGVPTDSLGQSNGVGDPPTKSENGKQQYFAACGSLYNYKMMQESA